MLLFKVLAKWYELNKRSLPWRSTKDPYKIWLSEIILQQTRVQQGLPYYLDFVAKYPTIEALAAAPLQDVLRTWQGLGCYSRARNLHKCAQKIVHDHNSKFPADFEELKKLPGIGNYTAAAIASFAFGKAVPVVDGNVLRFITRYLGIEDDIGKSSTQKKVFNQLQEMIPIDDPGTFNQGIMEFGSKQCTPTNPNCIECPFVAQCVAFQTNKVNIIPQKAKKPKIRSRFFNYFVIEVNKRFLMTERSGKDIWQGLFEFYLVESQDQNLTSPEEIEDPRIMQMLNDGYVLENESEVLKHLLSHQNVYAKFFHLKFSGLSLQEPNPDDSFYSMEEILALPKPVLITRYLEAGIENDHTKNP